MKNIQFFLKAPYVVPAVVVGGALILGVVLMERSGKTPINVKTPANVTSNQHSQNVVGRVVSISSGTLSIKDEKSSELRALSAGDTLHLSDTIYAGQGVKATLNLTTPKGISDDPELVFIRPKPGEEYPVNVKLERKDDGSVEAMINP